MRHIWNATKALKQSIKFTLIIHMQSADLATGPESHIIQQTTILSVCSDYFITPNMDTNLKVV